MGIDDTITSGLASAIAPRRRYDAAAEHFDAARSLGSTVERIRGLERIVDVYREPLGRVIRNLAPAVHQEHPNLVSFLPDIVAVLARHAGVKARGELADFWKTLLWKAITGSAQERRATLTVTEAQLEQLVAWVCQADLAYQPSR